MTDSALSRSRQDNLSEAISTANLTSGPNTLINTSGPISTDVPAQFKLTGVSSFRVGGDPTGAINTVPQFGTPTNILGPRIARFGVTFRF